MTWSHVTIKTRTAIQWSFEKIEAKQFVGGYTWKILLHI